MNTHLTNNLAAFEIECLNDCSYKQLTVRGKNWRLHYETIVG